MYCNAVALFFFILIWSVIKDGGMRGGVLTLAPEEAQAPCLDVTHSVCLISPSYKALLFILHAILLLTPLSLSGPLSLLSLCPCPTMSASHILRIEVNCI